MNLKNWQELANAVVKQAADDYRRACNYLKRENMTREGRLQAKRHKKECENFFQGEKIKIYTDLDGELILKKLQQELK